MPFNFERSTVNVRELIDKMYYDNTSPILFIINKHTYNFYEIVGNKQLLDTEVNNIKIEARLSQMTHEDIIKVVAKEDISSDLFDVVLPVNSHFYMIVITII
jgi:hypothetical protein